MSLHERSGILIDLISESINWISLYEYGNILLNWGLISENQIQAIVSYSISIYFVHTGMTLKDRYFEDSEYLFHQYSILIITFQCHFTRIAETISVRIDGM